MTTTQPSTRLDTLAEKFAALAREILASSVQALDLGVQCPLTITAAVRDLQGYATNLRRLAAGRRHRPAASPPRPGTVTGVLLLVEATDPDLDPDRVARAVLEAAGDHGEIPRSGQQPTTTWTILQCSTHPDLIALSQTLAEAPLPRPGTRP